MKLNLRTKLIGSFIIMLILMVVVGLMGTYTTKTIRDHLDNSIERDVKPANILGDVSRRVGFIRSNSLLHLLTKSSDNMNRYESEVADWMDKVNTDLNILENIFEDQATLDKLAEFRTAWETYLRIWREQVVPLSRANRDEEAFTLARKMGVGGMAAREARYKLDELHDVNVATANHRLKLATQDSRKSQYILSAVILLVIILGLALGIRQGSLIAGSVNTVSKAAQLVAAGDLDQRVMVKTGDEIESMANSFNTMTVKLKTMIEELQREITERRRAEDRLRESKQWLSTTLRSIGDAVIATDAEGLVTLMNPVAEDLTGWDEPETAGKPLEDIFNIINDQTGERAENPVDRVLREGVVVGLANHTVLIAKDGTKRPIADSGAPIRDKEGEIIGTVIVFRDITELKQAEEELRKHRDHLEELVKNRTEALRESEKKYREVVETSVDGVISVDSQMKVGVWNKGAERIFGYTEEKMIGYSLMKIVPERYKKEMEKGFVEFRKSGLGPIIGKTLELQGVRKDGTEIPVELSVSSRKKNETHIATAIVRDITERKKAEAALLRVQKLESVGILAGGIAHDFNNILTTILGNVSLAKYQVTPDDEIFDLLSEAETASARAQTLTRQLLTFAKGGVPVKETASIKDILKESCSFVLRGSKSRCEFSIAEDLWPAEVDVGQISQVINNIVINANQAMPEGGIIQVAAENLIIEDGYGLQVKPGRYIKISITDQGVGIAENHLLNIFDPYFTTKQEGSGLGLATTYSIIKKHAGHITVESQLGVGTTFYIYLPASEKAVLEKEKVKLIKGQGRILVMDDQASLRKMVGRMLGNLGYESEFAKDGAEAINMYKAAKESGKPYNAVILDLTIPGGMGGKEAIKKLLEIDPEVKAIVSSGYSDDPVLANFQEYGFKGMMPKPFESQSLSKVLHKVLQGEKE